MVRDVWVAVHAKGWVRVLLGVNQLTWPVLSGAGLLLLQAQLGRVWVLA